jgi:hypothetical protein
MAPAVTSPRPRALRVLDLEPARHLRATALASVPFWLLGAWALRAGWLSDRHAHVLAKALLAWDRGRLEAIGFVYPPVPFLLVLPWPSPELMVFWSGLAAGTAAWLVTYELRRRRLAPAAVASVVAATFASPAAAELTTGSLSELLASLAVVLAWLHYLNFVRARHTWSGFVSGLILGLAFFVHFHVLLYAVALALLAPFFARESMDPWEGLARVWVVVFPAVWSLVTWSYLSWVFQGDPFSFLRSAEAVVLGWAPAASGWRARLEDALRLAATELPRVPLVVVAGLLALKTAPRQAAAFVALLALPTVSRALGVPFSSQLAVFTYALVAALAVPRSPSPRAQRWLVTLAALQVAAAAAAGSWPWHRFHPSTPGEAVFARKLASLPPRSVLADDRSAYRLVAWARTARPFLLPPDREFTAAVENPEGRVAFVLVSTAPAPNDEVSRRFLERFRGRAPVLSWGPWRLYQVRESP